MFDLIALLLLFFIIIIIIIFTILNFRCKYLPSIARKKEGCTINFVFYYYPNTLEDLVSGVIMDKVEGLFTCSFSKEEIRYC